MPLYDWLDIPPRLTGQIARGRLMNEASAYLAAFNVSMNGTEQVDAALAELLRERNEGTLGGAGLEMVADAAALAALVPDAEEDDAVVDKFAGKGYRFKGGAFVELFDRPREEINSKSYGALGDSGTDTIDAADITAHASLWGALYEVGDTWDYVGLQESIFAAFANESLRVPTATIAAGSTTTLLQFSGTPFAGKNMAGGTAWITAGAQRNHRSQIVANTDSTLEILTAAAAPPVAGDTVHAVMWHASVTPASKKALYTPRGQYGVNKMPYAARVVGGVWRGAGRFATFIFGKTPRVATLAINGMSYSWVEGINFQTRSSNWYTTTLAPRLGVGVDEYIIPSHNGNLFRCTVAGTTGIAVSAGHAATGAGTARTIVSSGLGSEGAQRGRWVVVTGGLGVGAKAKIVWNTGTALYLDRDIAATDATSVFDIVREPAWSEFGTVGEEGADGTASWERVFNATVVDLDYDNRNENWAAKQQSNTFANCSFSGEGRGTPHCLTLARSGTSAMTSEHTFVNCYWQWSTLGSIGSYGDNALQNTIVGGNIASSSRYGIYCWAGGMYMYSLGMQNGIETQLLNAGADFYARVSNNDHSIASGIRSESLIFAKLENDHILSADACYINAPITEWAATTAYLPGKLVTGPNTDPNHDGRIWECVIGGVSGAGNPAWGVGLDAGDRISDGAVTWRLRENDTVSGAIHMRSCAFPWGAAAVGGNELMYSVSDTTLSRHDWMRAGIRLDATGAGRKLLPTYGVRHVRVFRNYEAAAGVGHPQRWNPLGVWPGAAGANDDPALERNRKRSMWSITDLGAGAALYFSNIWASVGIRRGDFENIKQREILAVEGRLGKMTPNNFDSTSSVPMTYPANARGEEFIVTGGLSTGSKAGGDFVVEVAKGGSAGTAVNLGEPKMRVTADGLIVTPGGGGTLPIKRDIYRSTTWNPGSVANASFVFTDVAVFGAVPGDVAKASFASTPGNGLFLDARVETDDVVRVFLYNFSGGAVDPPSLTLNIEVRSRQEVPAGVADVGLLASTIGNLSGAYDCRGGLTFATGVSQWDDARGAVGFGPPLVQAVGAAQPTQMADGTLLFSDSQELSSAADALFDLSTPKTLVVIAAILAGAQNALLGIDDGSGANRFLGVKANPQGNGAPQLYFSGSAWNDRANTDVEWDFYDRRLFILTRDPAANLTIEVADRAPAVDAVGSLIGAGNNRLMVPSRGGGAGFWMKVRAVLVFDKVLTDAEKLIVRQWAMSRHRYRAVGA